MKKQLLIFTCLLLYSLPSISQAGVNSLVPRVDKRVELLSIVFRIADTNDFKDTLNPRYTKAIYDHFGEYFAHPLIIYMKALMDSLQKDSISFGSWEVSNFAVHLGQPPSFQPVVNINDTSNDMWDDRTLLKTKLVSLLQRFYREADCEAFFQSQAGYYEQVEQQYKRLGTQLNKEWFTKFFNIETTENYYAIAGLCLRDGAYLRVNFQNNHRNTFTVFGCTAFDENGLPSTFASPMFPRSMLHEYIHAFTNQLIDKNLAELQKPAETILANPEVFKLFENTFYGNWRYLLYESLVRACSIKYMMDNTDMKANPGKEITVQEAAGFFWIKGLVNELSVYEKSRSRYKNIDSFMPEVIKYFTKTAGEINH